MGKIFIRTTITLGIAILLLTGIAVAQSLISATPILTKAITFINKFTISKEGTATQTADKINYDYDKSMLKITQQTPEKGKSYIVVQTDNGVTWKTK